MKSLKNIAGHAICLFLSVLWINYTLTLELCSAWLRSGKIALIKPCKTQLCVKKFVCIFKQITIVCTLLSISHAYDFLERNVTHTLFVRSAVRWIQRQETCMDFPDKKYGKNIMKRFFVLIQMVGKFIWEVETFVSSRVID